MELSRETPFHIIADNRGVADILCQRLRGCGLDASLAETALPHMQNIIFLPGINREEPEKIETALEINLQLFHLARTCGQQMSESTGTFITVQDTGGYFGLEKIEKPWLGGISALAKTAAREWPNATVKAIDIASKEWNEEKIAEELFREIVVNGSGLEVAINPKGRFTIDTFSEAEPRSLLPIADGSVVVVSGGARGVTAHCLRSLAENFSMKLAILGRTKIREEPLHLKNCQNQIELKKAIVGDFKREKKKIVPVAIQKEIQRIENNREIQNNLDELRKLGAEVSYYEVDVVDKNSVENVLAKIRKEWGSVQVLIHAAGVIADKHIHKKSTEQFQQVFGIKVQGFRNLLRATEQDELSHICCFSSIAARMGNTGQVDYAMGNEILNKVCQEQKLQNPNCAVTSINWGPWQGGMVTPELEAHFKSQGVHLIPLKEGADAFVREIQNSEQVEIVMGNELPEPHFTFPKNWQIWVHESTYPLLHSHKIQGKPVVPVVLVNEWCLRLARRFAPKKFALTKNLKVIKGVPVEDFAGKGKWLSLEMKNMKEIKGGKGKSEIQFVLKSDQGQHYQVVIELFEKMPLLSLPTLPSLSKWNPAADIYEEQLFHGPDFAVIKELTGISSDSCAATLQSISPFSQWQSNIALVDGGLQLVLLFLLNKHKQISLPTGMNSICLGECSLFEGEISCFAQCSSDNSLHSVWDIYYFRDDKVIGEIRGLSMHAVPSNFT